ncbi:LysR family transcriptional regulator [Streptomonospora wellingtoniae]|uniref:LysR substrate-binding domain-containing protein n=1 Tax=Streptomonospora wellingtoniae TaxID=3075544 RepID=A0ABU2KNL1_9ACTN|nr:LysR substrate-binding domain-containing protein [Streptomonospora sp. DSM 45055]MDT0300855.1 LysR substrate-binding domain-containing protein [Streptomonospora sp. DSM 45055]
MELRQLEYFVAVAEERHFTRAAQRVLVAQSGLSASIRSLERELGARLFVRSTRRVELTDAGRALLPEARHVLAKVSGARDAVAAVQSLLRGTLTVGSLQCLAAPDVPALLGRFHGKHSGVEIRLQQDGAAALLEGVRRGAVDVAFTSTGAGTTADLEELPIGAEPMVLACALAHPLAERGRVALGELDGAAFVDFGPASGIREEVDAMLAGADARRRVAVEVNDVHSLLAFAAQGLGIALVPEHFSVKTSEARFVPIEDAPQWRTAAVTAAGSAAGTAARALLAMVEEDLAPGRGTPAAGRRG